MKTSADRYAAIDGLRGLAALYVVFFHTVSMVWPFKDHYQPWHTWPFLYGHYAVTIFVTLSGFCLALPIIRNGMKLSRGVWHFMKRRALRILPAYYAAIFFSLALVGSYYPRTWAGTIGKLLLACDLYDWSAGNSALWSMPVEWRLYLLMPLILWGWRRVGFLKTITVSALITIPLAYWLGGMRDFRYSALHYLVFFLAGMGAAYLVTAGTDRAKTLLHNRYWPIFCILFAGLFVRLQPYYPGGHWFVMQDIALLPVIFSFLILLCSGRIAFIEKVLSCRTLSLLGVFSYSLYLIHLPILRYGLNKINTLGYSQPITYVLMLAVVIPTILLTAYLFYRLFERPFISPAKARQSLLPIADIRTFSPTTLPESPAGGGGPEIYPSGELVAQSVDGKGIG